MHLRLFFFLFFGRSERKCRLHVPFPVILLVHYYYICNNLYVPFSVDQRVTPVSHHAPK